MTPAEVFAMAKEHNTRAIDLKFVDLPGLWQHFTITPSEFHEELFEKGIGFDGSSIRGFQEIHESDMLLMPDPDSAFIDPVMALPTLSLICDVWDPVTKKPYSRDPRYIAKKAEGYLKSAGIGDTAFIGPEAEFFLFDEVRYEQTGHSASYFVDSVEGEWNSGKAEGPNLGYKPRLKEGYFPVAPHDSLQDLRSLIVVKLQEIGVPVEVHHHEVATAGQCEIDMKFGPLTQMADNVLKYKYVVKNIAHQQGKVATFMPKPLFGDNGSGMHCHQSIWKGGQNLFFDPKGYAMLSPMAKWYIGGLLKHAKSILAFAAPTTNSYKRLVPGYEAPVNLAYSQRNRSAAVRIPMYSDNPKAKRLEFRPPDPSCNPYLTFAAMLMAGLDGIEKKLDPGEPMDRNIYELTGADRAKVPTVSGSLQESLEALKADHEYLLKGGVFTPDVIDMWVKYKVEKEVDPVRIRPVPYEFYLYFDV
jgi:glutamine synthetase